MRILCKPKKLELVPKPYPFRETNVEILLECGHILTTYSTADYENAEKDLPQSVTMHSEYECKDCLKEYDQFRRT